jgi:hypothetical protein
MKKTVSVACALVLVLGLCVSGALAYDIDDNTLVQPWLGNSVTGPFTDIIGLADTFSTFGANLSGNTFSIFTNWNPGKNGAVNAAVKTADLFIDVCCDGSWDYAIVLDSTRPDFGYAYEAPLTVTTSQDIFSPLSGLGLTYGGRFDEAAPKPTPVLGTSGDYDIAAITWTIGTGGLNNQVDIDLSDLDELSSPWGFYWGTATCSNDGFSGCVPVPPSVLLMGSGLLGVGLLGWRRRGSEDQVG